MNSSRRFRSFLGLMTAVLALTFVVGSVVSLYRARRVLQAAQAATPALFDQGLAALDPQAPADWTNETCGSCHKDEYQQWMFG